MRTSIRALLVVDVFACEKGRPVTAQGHEENPHFEMGGARCALQLAENGDLGHSQPKGGRRELRIGVRTDDDRSIELIVAGRTRDADPYGHGESPAAAGGSARYRFRNSCEKRTESAAPRSPPG